MMHDTVFSWHLLDAQCALTRFTMVVDAKALGDIVHQSNRRRRGTRCKDPAKAMRTALIVCCV